MSILYGAVLEFLRDRFKGALSHAEEEFAVGVANVEVAGGDSERVSLTFVNLAATNLFLAPSVNVSATHGLRLAPNGGTVSMNVNDDALLPALNWWCVSSGADGALFVLSVRRTRITPKAEGG